MSNIEKLIQSKMAHIDTLEPKSHSWFSANETLSKLIKERHDKLGIIR